MDRRRSIRIPYDEPVEITSLRESGGSQQGRSKNLSDDGMCLWVAGPIDISTPVQVAWGNSLIMGEVCRCDRHGDGYTIALHLNQVLTMTAQLRSLAVALQGNVGQRVELNRPS